MSAEVIPRPCRIPSSLSEPADNFQSKHFSVKEEDSAAERLGLREKGYFLFGKKDAGAFVEMKEAFPV